MSNLIKFYTNILDAGSMIADDSGAISARVGNSTTPQNVGGKRLVLPTMEMMSKADKSEVVMFHPMHENIMRNESDVMAKFRANCNIRLNYTLQAMLGHLFVIASSTGLHSQLRPDQFELISLLKDVDEKTIESYKSLVKAMPLGNIDKCFVHIFIRKGATLEGKNYRRGAIVAFPLYEELCKTENTIYGVKLRRRDHATFKAVIEKLFPNIDKQNSYSSGSNNDTAPTLVCLLKAVMNLAASVNDIVDDYGHILEDLKQLRYNDEWVDELNDLSKFAIDLALAPPQAGNDGPAPSTTVMPPPIVNVNPQPIAPPQQIQQPQPYGYQQPQPAPGPQQASGPVLTANGKLDFVETMRRIPGAFQQPNQGYGYSGYGQPPSPMTNRQGVPAFAQPSQQYGQPVGYGQQPMGYPTQYQPMGGGYGALGNGI